MTTCCGQDVWRIERSGTVARHAPVTLSDGRAVIFNGFKCKRQCTQLVETRLDSTTWFQRFHCRSIGPIRSVRSRAQFADVDRPLYAFPAEQVLRPAGAKGVR